MSIYYKVAIMCDACHESDEAVYETDPERDAAVDSWLDDGWVVDECRHLCIDCSEGEK